MARKVSLPVTDTLLDAIGPPTLAAMRAKLGGRADLIDHPAIPVGAIVVLAPSDGLDPPSAAGMRVGVILSVGALDADVYLTRGMVKRTLASLVTLHDPGRDGAIPAELDAIRPSVEAFARLKDGQKVFFERTPGTVSEGTLLEKCRYGALVGDADGKVLGVGFRKLFDTPPLPANAN